MVDALNFREIIGTIRKSLKFRLFKREKFTLQPLVEQISVDNVCELCETLEQQFNSLGSKVSDRRNRM